MALSITTTGSRISGQIPGFGFFAVSQIVWDNSYPTGGETCDLSGVFPNEVYGGAVFADTLNDGGYKCSYVLAAAGAPATGVIQAYWVDTTTDGAPMAQVVDMTDVSAMNGQTWLFAGR